MHDLNELCVDLDGVDLQLHAMQKPSVLVL